MSNSPEMVIALVQRLDIGRVRAALDCIDPRQSQATDIIEHFIDNVELIQGKTIRQVPALFKKVNND